MLNDHKGGDVFFKFLNLSIMLSSRHFHNSKGQVYEFGAYFSPTQHSHRCCEEVNPIVDWKKSRCVLKRWPLVMENESRCDLEVNTLVKPKPVLIHITKNPWYKLQTSPVVKSKWEALVHGKWVPDVHWKWVRYVHCKWGTLGWIRNESLCALETGWMRSRIWNALIRMSAIAYVRPW